MTDGVDINKSSTRNLDAAVLAKIVAWLVDGEPSPGMQGRHLVDIAINILRNVVGYRPKAINVVWHRPRALMQELFNLRFGEYGRVARNSVSAAGDGGQCKEKRANLHGRDAQDMRWPERWAFRASLLVTLFGMVLISRFP